MNVNRRIFELPPFYMLRVHSIDPIGYSVYSGIRIKFQNSLLICRTSKYLVKSYYWGKRDNSVVFFL